MPNLDLPESIHAKVWKKCVSILRSDVTLDRAVQTWVTYDGSPLPGAENLTGAYPLLQLVPSLEAMPWESPASFAGHMSMRIRMFIQSVDAEDYFNLWQAIVRAFYPLNDVPGQFAIEQALLTAGATTGQVEFIQPPSAAGALINAENCWALEGVMRVQVRHNFNP